MPNTVELDALLKLNARDRARIAFALLDSLDTDEMPQGPDEEELKRRLEEYRKVPSSAVPWDEARKRLGWD